MWVRIFADLCQRLFHYDDIIQNLAEVNDSNTAHWAYIRDLEARDKFGLDLVSRMVEIIDRLCELKDPRIFEQDILALNKKHNFICNDKNLCKLEHLGASHHNDNKKRPAALYPLQKIRHMIRVLYVRSVTLMFLLILRRFMPLKMSTSLVRSQVTLHWKTPCSH